MTRKPKATYRFGKGGLFTKAMDVEAAGPPVRGLVVNVRPSWGPSRPVERNRWNITHARSGRFVLRRLNRKTALSVRDKLVDLADWDMPVFRMGDRHRRITKLAQANPREFAVNGGGMEKA